MGAFFTADTHWFHENVIGFANRPYRDLSDMHEQMVAHWNYVVSPNDEVFHLGDVSFGNAVNTLAVLNRLNGRMRYVPGNHDKKLSQFIRPNRDDVILAPLYERRFDLGEGYDCGGQKIVMCHYALAVWNQSHYGSWMLHGHSHGSMDERNKSTKRLDVGWDGQAARHMPISLREVADIMQRRVYEVVDNHGKER